MLAAAMGVTASRTAAAVIALTMCMCVVVVAGDGPLRSRPAPYEPTTAELRQVGVITSDFPVPGALPPEIFPPESYGLGPPGPPDWLLWALGALGAGAVLWVAVRLVREVMTWRIRWPRLRFPRWRRRRVAAAGAAETAVEPAEFVPDDDSSVAQRAVDAALEPLREPADPRAAVIEAYARMEAVLAARELGRRTPEAPREYLRRVLRERGMPEDSLTTLTALFEEARFSRHPIPDSAPRRAATELEAARLALDG
jgi:Domain of unknown function (DUF4129)